MRRMLKMLLPLALVSAACASKSSPPVVNDFKATPSTITAGQKSTLSWSVSGATQISLDNGLGVQVGNSVDVTPAATTTYRLTATGSGGTTTATLAVTVNPAVGKAEIIAFTASPSSVATGGSVKLSWTVTGQVDTLTVDPGGIDVKGETTFTSGTGTGSHTIASVQAAITFTLTATNSGGTATREAPVTTHLPGLRLQYTDPTSTAARLLLVRNAASTNERLILDLKVGASPVTAFGVALTIPFDSRSAGMLSFAASSATSLGGITEGTIRVGSNPPTAAAILGAPGSAMPNVFSVGVAKKKSVATEGDDIWAAGWVLFSVAFNMTGSAAPGMNVFTALSLPANPRFRAAALRKDATEAVSAGDIALGDFIISL